MDGGSLFKKRGKGIRNSASTGSLSRLVGGDDNGESSVQQQQAKEERATAANAEDDGDATVVRSSVKAKKGALGRVQASSKPAPKSRLSFGVSTVSSAADDEQGADETATTPTRKLLRQSNTNVMPSATSISNSASSLYSQDYLDKLKSDSTRPSHTVTAENNAFDSLTRSKFPTSTSDHQMSVDMDADLVIPTTAAIASAKSKREQLRAQGGTAIVDASNDYMPLTVGFANKKGDSRLIHEDDEIGDGADELADYTGAQERLPLGKKANAEAAQRLKESMNELIIDAQEDDDEDELGWEAAQLKRIETRNRADDLAETERKSKKAYTPAPIPQTGVIPTLSSLSSRLAAALSTLQQSHAVDSQALAHFDHERAQLDEQERELRAEVEKTARKGEWFDETRQFVDTLAGFLDEKMPLLESIEQKFEQAQKERFERVSRRRWASLSDDLALVSDQSVPTFPPALSQSADSDGETATFDHLAPRSFMREVRRKAARAVGPPSLTIGEKADLEAATAEMRLELDGLFSDVRSSDFRDPSLGILSRFEEYRKRYRKEFDMSFAGLGLVQCWEFWARIEQWGVALDQPQSLTTTNWWRHLEHFSHPDKMDTDANEDEEADAPMEEENLINNLIVTVVTPRLLALMPSFDPFDGKMNAVLVDKVEEVSYAVDKSAPRFMHLMNSIFDKFDEAIEGSSSLILPILPSIQSAPFDPAVIPARQRVLDTHLTLLTNLVKWRAFDRDRTNERAEWLVERVMAPLVECAWETGGNEVGARIVDVWKDAGALLRRRLLRQ